MFRFQVSLHIIDLNKMYKLRVTNVNNKKDYVNNKKDKI